jgi:cell division protein ZapB
LTRAITRSILKRMNLNDPNSTSELDLNKLETQVDELIRTIGRLTEENRNLRGKQQELMSERAELIEKTELARSRVEAMISRLRSIETG